MKYKTWDFENDIVVTKGNLMFPTKTAQKYMGSAYAVETEKGIFYQKMRPDEKFDLYHVDLNGERIIEEDIEVVASDLKYTCIIVYYVERGEYYLIDVRGEFYLLEINRCISKPAQYSMKLDRSTGYYNVENKDGVRWILRGVSKKTQFERMMKSAPTGEVELNPKFKSVFGKYSVGDYLYLTIMNSKKGKMLEYILQTGLPFEVVPNVFVGDTTRNIRIPINEQTLNLKIMHFLLEKYTSTYAIMGIPIEKYIGTIDIPVKEKAKLSIVCSPVSDSQYTKVMSTVNTLKMCYGCDTDLDIFKKVFKKIVGLFPDMQSIQYRNCFGALELPYPDNSFHGYEVHKDIICRNIEYINGYLIPHKPIKNVEVIDRISMVTIYKEIYELSKQYRKKQMQDFEDLVIGKMNHQR